MTQPSAALLCVVLALSMSLQPVWAVFFGGPPSTSSGLKGTIGNLRPGRSLQEAEPGFCSWTDCSAVPSPSELVGFCHEAKTSCESRCQGTFCPFPPVPGFCTWTDCSAVVSDQALATFCHHSEANCVRSCQGEFCPLTEPSQLPTSEQMLSSPVSPLLPPPPLPESPPPSLLPSGAPGSLPGFCSWAECTDPPAPSDLGDVCHQNPSKCESSCSGSYCWIDPLNMPPMAVSTEPAEAPAENKALAPEGPEASGFIAFSGKTCDEDSEDKYSIFSLNDYSDSSLEACEMLCAELTGCSAYVVNPEVNWLCRVYTSCQLVDGDATDTAYHLAATAPASTPARGSITGVKCSQDEDDKLSIYSLNDYDPDVATACLMACEELNGCSAYVVNTAEYWICHLFTVCTPSAGSVSDTTYYMPSSGDGGVPPSTGFQLDSGATCNGDTLEKYSQYDLNDWYADNEFQAGCEELCQNDERCAAYVYDTGGGWLCRLYETCKAEDGDTGSLLGIKG